MKKKRTLVVLSAVLIMLFAFYFIVTLLNNNNNANKTQEITVLNYENGIEKIDVLKNGGYTLIYSDGQWLLEQDTTAPLNQELIQEMVNGLTPLIATTQTTQNLLSQQEYGLTEPYNVVTVTANETDTVLTFGSVNPYTQDTYMTVSGHDELYTVTSSTVLAFDNDIKSLIKIDEWEITSPSQIQSVNFSSDILISDGLYIEIERTLDENTPVKYSVTTKDEQFYANADNASILVSNLSMLYYTACENYNVQNTELEQYGLQTPVLTLEIVATDYDGTDISLVLLIGAQSEDGAYYVKEKDSTVVNKMDGLFISEILNANAQNLK